MYLKTIYEMADSLAPFALSKEYCEKYNAYDNSGIQLDCGGEIKHVLFSLDLSKAAIAKAKELGANCIITHHPAIFGSLTSLQEEGAGSEILECAKSGISVISAHLNLDCASGGIDDCLMKGLTNGTAEQVMEPLTQGGYGKISSRKETPMNGFIAELRETFFTDKIVAYGNKAVKKVASFCGAGMSSEAVSFALESGADTFVSSDGKHHLIKELFEKGVNVVLLTHYAAEYYGFNRFYQKFLKLLKESNVRANLFTDERFL